MTTMELLLTVGLLGASAVARQQALQSPPAELLENLDMLEAMGLLEGEGEGEDE